MLIKSRHIYEHGLANEFDVCLADPVYTVFHDFAIIVKPVCPYVRLFDSESYFSFSLVSR